jgi:hypothetical protein
VTERADADRRAELARIEVDDRFHGAYRQQRAESETRGA